MTDARLNEICEVIAKPEKMEKLVKEGPEAAAAAFAAEGYDFTVVELSEAVKRLDEMAEAQSGDELTEDALEDVAGGIGVLATIAIGAAIGTYLYWKKNK